MRRGQRTLRPDNKDDRHADGLKFQIQHHISHPGVVIISATLATNKVDFESPLHTAATELN